MDQHIQILLTIPGIAEKTYTKYLDWVSNVKPTQKSVRKALRQHLADLPAITRADIIYNPMRKVPRVIIEYVVGLLTAANLGIFVGGSFVRGKPTSGDMDILIYKDFWDEIYSKFRTAELLIREPFASGDHKIATMLTVRVPDGLLSAVREYLEPHNYFSGGRINIKADFFTATPTTYLTTKLFVVGSGRFNIFMRSQAKKQGYLLNNDGLFKAGKPVKLQDEKHIFKILGIKYREYTERN